MTSFRRKIKARSGIPLLAAAGLFFAALTPLHAQSLLNPVNSDIGTSSLTFTWTDPGESCTMALSTMSDFSALTATGSLSGAATTYLNLALNETYFFRIKRAAAPDSDYETQAASPSITYAAAPSGIYFETQGFAADSSDAAEARLGWNINGNPEWTEYLLEYSEDSGLAGAPEISEYYPPVSLGALKANTTYYFRVKAVNLGGNQSAPSGIASSATLALSLPGISAAVYETSSTISWTPVNGGIQAQDSEGYRLILSRSENFDAPLPGWSTSDHNSSSASLTGLERNTAYYYKVGALNWYGAMNSDHPRSFTTLTSSADGFTLISAGTQTARLGWTALPAAPSSATALGYRLEASSTGFNGAGVYLSTVTYDILESTLTLRNLEANTTYYFRVGTLNQALMPNYSARLSTITLTLPLSADLLPVGITPDSLTVSITRLPAAPQSASCEGYLLEGSSRAFGSGSVVYSSFSYANNTGSLTLDNLRPNTTYYLRMATLNWTRTPNFTNLPPAITSVGNALVSVPVSGIWRSSAAVTFAPLDSDGYTLEASLTGNFNAITASSSTTNPAASGLAVPGLDENTIYYFRAGALYNGATVYTLTVPPALSTLAKPLGSPVIAGVFHTSATVSWTPLAESPQKDTAESYRLDTSTSPDFIPLAHTAATGDPGADRLTALALIPNTSYYFRAAAVNWDGAENYVYTPATSTLAAPPIQQAFTGQTTSAMTVNWLAAQNPPDTVYVVRFSSGSGFSAPVYSSVTVNSYASFADLQPNTTYYPEVTALNRLNVPEGPYLFDAMATLAFDPVPGAYSGLGVSSITLNWGRGDNPPGDTYYRAEISSSPGFSGAVLSSATLAVSAAFSGLVSNATYYLRVSALNRTGVGTQPVPLAPPEALTLPATAYILPPGGTFSDLMTDGFTLHWAGNGNSSHTIYELEISTAGDFNASAAGSTASVRGLDYTFTALLTDTTYWARIRSRGQTGLASDFAGAGYARTLLSNQTSATIGKDNLVTLQASYGLFSVFLPAGSLGGSTQLSLRTITPADAFMPPVSAVSALRPTGIGLVITCRPSVLVLNPVTIVLPYRPADLPAGVDRTRLVLALYDESSRVWVPLQSVSDQAGNKVTARTWHLSTFQLMESASPATLDAVKIYPNPYAPSSVSGVMHFDNMPPYARVKIYTFLGELVKEFSADVNGMASWDGKNSSGRKAASGVYIALLKTRDKGSAKMVKVVLER